MAKHFLYLTNDKLVSLIIRGGILIGRENFGVADIPTPDFEKFVDKHASLQTYVVTDLIEEDFRLDTIPHLRGSDQDAVLDRKLGQIYRASPFRHAVVQGREEDGRRNDHVFLHAVTNPDLLKSLLVLLERLQVPIEGVYSSAVLSSRLLKELDIFFPHTLLVTIIPDFGLRQTYFKDKQVKFSRLTPIIYDESRSVGELIAAEISRTWQYLDSLRYFAEADSLEVCMLIHEQDRAMIQAAIRSYPMLRYRFLDITEVADRLKVSPAPTSSHAEEILCHVYSRGALENHFAAATDTRFATFRLARIGIFSATAAVLVAGGAWAGFNFYHATQITQGIESKSLLERNLQSEFRVVVQSMSVQKMATDAVRDTSAFFNSQIRPTPSAPSALLRELATTLDAFPAVSILEIVWAATNDASLTPPKPTGGAVTSAMGGASQFTSDTRPSTGTALLAAVKGAIAAQWDDLDPALPGNKYQVAQVEAAISPFTGDLRAALLEIERLAEEIRRGGNLIVTVVRLPVELEPIATLKVIDRAEATAKEARFALHISRKVPGT